MTDRTQRLHLVGLGWPPIVMKPWLQEQKSQGVRTHNSSTVWLRGLYSYGCLSHIL